MRPLRFDFVSDPRAWEVEDAFLLAPDASVAPVLAAGARGREVYLPVGARWVEVRSGQQYAGGHTYVS